MLIYMESTLVLLQVVNGEQFVLDLINTGEIRETKDEIVYLKIIL